jgi:hypothetical protein
MHRHLNLAQWAHAHPLLSAAIVAVFAIAVLAASRSGRSIQRRHDKALADEGRRARSLGLDLSYREAELLARLERPWWRRGRR